MSSSNVVSRRVAIKSSVFGLMAVSIPNLVYSKSIYAPESVLSNSTNDRFPAIADEVVSTVVGKSHFDLEGVMELVNKRPELSRATWDWAFGDWESAVGAASHVGRRDIVRYLLSKGAKPNIFTFAMLGSFDTVKSMIEFYPGIQKNYGPHGISLLSHAKVGLRKKDEMTSTEIENSEKLIDYLEALGDADGETYLEMTDDKNLYVGDYKYGDADHEGFSVKVNMRELLSLGKLGAFGGALYKTGNNTFVYNGAPSVEVSFQKENNKVVSLTLKEPDLTLVAKKV